jgi:hypothetical protein
VTCVWRFQQMQQDAVLAKLQKSKIIILKKHSGETSYQPNRVHCFNSLSTTPNPLSNEPGLETVPRRHLRLSRNAIYYLTRFNINMVWRRLTPVGINMTSNRHHVYTANLKSCKNIQQLTLRWSDARWSQYLISSDLWSLSSLKIGRCIMWVAKPSAASVIQ